MSPATKVEGGTISARIALSLEATAAVAVGDLVHITGDYECQKADGTKPIVGRVVAVRQEFPSTGGNRVTVTPGLVGVDAFGFAVYPFTAGAAVAAGARVRLLGTNGKVDDSGTNEVVGIALMSSAADGDVIDVLVQV